MSYRDLGALTALRRLRHAETETARRDLGEALGRESILASRQTTLGHEIEAARQFSGDFDREAFAAWFARVRADRERLAAAVREAEAFTVTVRTRLAHRRVAETAAEAALADALAVRKAANDRREQMMLEDVARALQRRTG
jgi:hypothetical protein